MQTTATTVRALAQQGRDAAKQLATTSGAARAAALNAMPDALDAVRQPLMEANRADLEAAEEAGLPPPLVKRLAITDRIFDYMKWRLSDAAALPDPLGRTLAGHTSADGLRVAKVTVPLGVIGIIYESRPSVTTDAAAVCLKSGNAVILRGGSESLRTNTVLADAMLSAVTDAGLPEGAVQLIRTTGHDTVHELLKMHTCIDVLIPRGGKGLIESIVAESRIPVIKHLDGVCHLYLAADAPTDEAVAITVNSKTQRVEVCNALETLLVDVASADRLLPPVTAALADAGVECRGCRRCRAIVPDMVPASEIDWDTEYLAPVLAVRVVDDVADAIDHIARYGSGHTDGIVTRRSDWIEQFTQNVDSSSVMVNASTRLSGGGAYGLGAVVGISTDRLHVRGPVGPDDLTSTKWVARGNGHLRA